MTNTEKLHSTLSKATKPMTLNQLAKRARVNINTARRLTNGMADYLLYKNGTYQRVFEPVKTSITV